MAAPKENQYALGNSGGRPPKYETPQQLESEVIAFFQHCMDNKSNPGVTKLALFLGFASRQSLFDYKQDKEFAYIIQRALLVVESHYEDALNTFRSSGAIFALKNMGWKDQVDQNISQTITNVSPIVKDTGVNLANNENDILQ